MNRMQKGSLKSPILRGAGKSLIRQGLCKYPHRICNLSCLENYDYCLKHILEDRSAPYRPCLYLYTNSGKKCGKPALRNDAKDNLFCAEHCRKANLQKLRGSSRCRPPVTRETLIASLAHYVPKEQNAVVKKETSIIEETGSKASSQSVDPFVDLDAAQINAGSSQVLDYLSETDSDAEPATLDSMWRDQNHESSDAESVDSQAEDPLKYAGVYTAEEVSVIIKDKMIRLQSLYIDQFRRLQHLLKERRRKYLHALKKEKDALCSIHEQEKSTAQEQKLYQKLKALNRYHKYYGEEAVLHKKMMERRAQATDNFSVRGSHKGKCAFTEGGVKCGIKTLPTTKYCRKHILEDTQQVLFRACGVKRDDHSCLEPTLNVFENATCVYHLVLPPRPHFPVVPIESTSKAVKVEAMMNKVHHDDAAIVDTLLSLGSSAEELLKPAQPVCKPSPAKSPAAMQTLTLPAQAEVPSTSVSLVTPNKSATEVEEKSHATSVVPEHNYCVGPSLSLQNALLDVSKEDIPQTNTVEEPATSETETAVTTDTEVAENAELDPEMSDLNGAAKETGDAAEKMDVEEEDLMSGGVVVKQESHQEEELQIVDVAEVGVVEEVLSAEVKPQEEESMQLEEEIEPKDG